MNYMPNQLGIWEIAVLATLRESPMHPYQMQRLLHDRHKDEILALKRGSLYHAIGRLERAGLIEAVATTRDGRRPERTTYQLTPSGLGVLLETLRKVVARPRRESSEFMAALAYLIHLTPEEAIACLEDRLRLLEKEIGQTEIVLKAASAWVARINLIETEYLLAMLRAERDWVAALARDLRDALLAWDLDKIYARIRASTEAAGALEEQCND
jgi:DNA-binding PadR family transcriptional regulator